MTTLFISDLHVDQQRPEIARQLQRFLRDEAADADRLYILGDLFESWVGDDDPNPHYADVKTALARLVDRGTPVAFMHGNRDFMIGEDFAAETGVNLLDDPTVVDLHGRRVLLTHGDAMCTDDIEYQQVRAMTRNPEWQAMMRAKPLDERLAFAGQARERSAEHAAGTAPDIMDVNSDAVAATFEKHGVTTMLHGHTHRPAVHEIDIGGKPHTRIVLGDWYEQGSVVRWSSDGFELVSLPRAGRNETGTRGPES